MIVRHEHAAIIMQCHPPRVRTVGRGCRADLDVGVFQVQTTFLTQCAPIEEE